jgi:hypothetical protein
LDVSGPPVPSTVVANAACDHLFSVRVLANALAEDLRFRAIHASDYCWLQRQTEKRNIAAMQQDSHAWHPVDAADAIRIVFLSPQPFYLPPAVGALLGWSLEEVETAIRDGELEAERTCSGWRVPWDAVASALTAQSPLHDVEAALGTRATSESMPPDSSLPPSATPARSELKLVELPRWQPLMLARLAAREHSDPGDYLSRHLLDLAVCESEFLSSEIPGFLEAVRWPDGAGA